MIKLPKGLTKAEDVLSHFFKGYVYPPVVCAMILISHLTGTEFFFNIINILLAVAALCICDTIRPFITVFTTYPFQFARETNLYDPSKQDFYFSGSRLPVIVVLFVLVTLAAFFFLAKNRAFTKERLRELPLIPSLPILLCAFLVNGAFSAEWNAPSLAYGAVQLFSFGFAFYLFYLGLIKEKGQKLAEYLSYTSALIAILLTLETLALYLTNDALFADGSVVKEQVLYGWGNWNTAGQCIALTIPMCFYGAMKNKYPWFYFAAATLAFLSAALTLSRNAFLFAGLAYVSCVIIACFFGNNKRAFRVLVPIGIAAVLLLAFVFREKLITLLSDYVNRGFSDNGRFEHWKEGFSSFLKAPIFGVGFFGGVPTDNGIFPVMVHNTPLQLLRAMGIVGFVSYFYYRFETARIFMRPTLEKTMLGISLLVILLGSLLDNFVFYVHQMLYYPIILSAAFIIFRGQDENTSERL